MVFAKTIDESKPMPFNHEKPDITKGIPVYQNYEVIDGVRIPKELAELPFVKEDHKIKVIFTLLEPPLEKNGRASVINLQQEKLIKSLKERELDFEVISRTKRLYNQITILIPISEFNKLKNLPYVKRMSFPRVWKVNLDYSVPLIQEGAPSGGLGFSGNGVVVGIVDTGIDYNHPDLGGPGFPNSKVIDGYDFGDNDPDPMDCQGHGTHVAGIVAANGAVEGVAKDAKLIVAKIVPGCEGWATSEAIISAFEYMVNKGVDVINMSFGSPCGFNSPDDPEQIAIANAVNAGIAVAISAGNDYWQYHPYYWPDTFANGKDSHFTADIGVVGDPSTVPGVISVAASYNSHQTNYAFYTDDPNISGNYVSYTVAEGAPDPLDIFSPGEDLQYVYCGFGTPGEIPDSVAGKIALIKRGSYTFAYKAKNAQDKGAIGVVIFNNSPGLIGITVEGAGIHIPVVLIDKAPGEQLASDDGNGYIIRFDGTVKSDPLSAKDNPVSFSSWGTTPSMLGKPEVTAPGGYIWSTVPGGSYASFSGTSMASPHVAGASALLLEKNPNLTPEEIKKDLMITSDVLRDTYWTGSDRELPPRWQGAGRINLVNALNNLDYMAFVEDKDGNVYMTGDTEGNTTYTFELHLKNGSGSDLTYNLSGVDFVDFLYVPKYYSNDISFEDSSHNPITSITVPANSEVTFYAILDLSNIDTNFENVFVEGFVYLNSTGPQPDLHLPFSILHGDWQDTSYDYGAGYYAHNPVIDPPAYDPDEWWWWFGYTWLYYQEGDVWYPLGEDFNGDLYRNKIAFSPDGDGSRDSLWCLLSLLRGTKDLKFNVLDSSGKKIVTPIEEKWVRKNTLDPYWYQFWSGWDQDWIWDGTDSNGHVLPDGNYTWQIQAEVPQDPTGAPTSYDTKEFPVIIDTVPPFVKWSVSNTGGHIKLTWTASDDRSGIWGFNIYKDGVLVDTVGPDAVSYDFPTLTSTHGHYFTVEAVDFAGNHLPAFYNDKKGYYVQFDTENKKIRVIWPERNYDSGWLSNSSRYEYDPVSGDIKVVYADKRIHIVFLGNLNTKKFRLMFNDRISNITIHEVYP